MKTDRNEIENGTEIASEDTSVPEIRESGDFFKGMLLGVLIAGVVFLAAMLFRFGTIRSGKDAGADVLTSRQVQEKLKSVQSIIEDDALEEPDADLLETYMFKGIAVGLDDRYAAYFTREEQEEAQKENRGAYRGIGVVFTQYEKEENENGSQAGQEDLTEIPVGKRGFEEETLGIKEGAGENETVTQSGEAQSDEVTEDDEPLWEVVVTKVYDGGPAKEAGVKKGDVLSKVNGQDVTGLSLDLVMEQINKAFGENEEVTFAFMRDGAEVLIPIREAEVPLAKVTYELLEDGIGYIQIPEFDDVTPDQFRESLKALQEEAGEEGLKGLVLDVRDNPGGVLESVAEILDELLDECVMLTSSNAKGVQERLVAKDGKLYDGNMVVLADGNSASAAEVFAGVLQDQGAAKVVGSTTYGKGTIQHTYKLSDGSAFKLTSEKYAIGGTKEIDGVGITPDVEVEPVTDAAGKDKKKGTDNDQGEEKEDPVLAAAVDLLR